MIKYIINFFAQKKAVDNKAQQNDYVPSFWIDDYCQKEIVPYENKDFIIKSIEQIESLGNKSQTDYGFTEIFERGQMPIKTVSKEIRIDYLKQLLLDCGLEKAENINRNGKIRHCETGNTKAYGFSNFTVFFDIEGEFVKNIWISIGLVVSVIQYRQIVLALYCLGEECQMVLADWNESELYDLSHKTQIETFVDGYWK